MQLYLGQRAAEMGYHGAEHGREAEGLEVTTRRLQSVDLHLAQYPHDSEIRTLKAKLLGGLAAAHEHTGQQTMSAHFIQRATNEIESVLGDDPSDLKALSLSVELAISDLNATLGNHIRFSSVLNRTRDRLQLLRSLNPRNQGWLAWEAQLAHLESIDAFRIGDLDGARNHEEKTLDLAMSMDATGGSRCKMVGGAFLTLGTIEHLAGNRNAARACVLHLQEVIRKLRANPGLGEPLQEWEAMLTLAILHTRMGNFAELERVSREVLASESKFAELALYDREWQAYQRELRTAIANGLHGRALFELGHPEDAIGPLQISVTRFRNRPSTAPHGIYSTQLILENAVSLGYAHANVETPLRHSRFWGGPTKGTGTICRNEVIGSICFCRQFGLAPGRHSGERLDGPVGQDIRSAHAGGPLARPIGRGPPAGAHPPRTVPPDRNKAQIDESVFRSLPGDVSKRLLQPPVKPRPGKGPSTPGRSEGEPHPVSGLQPAPQPLMIALCSGAGPKPRRAFPLLRDADWLCQDGFPTNAASPGPRCGQGLVLRVPGS